MRYGRVTILIFMALAIVAGCGRDRGSDLVVGIWEGRLQYPGIELRIVFRIEKSPVGTLTAFLLTPDQDDREV